MISHAFLICGICFTGPNCFHLRADPSKGQRTSQWSNRNSYHKGVYRWSRAYGKGNLSINNWFIRDVSARTSKAWPKELEISIEDTTNIIKFRYLVGSGKENHPFDDSAIKTIHDLSKGIPRNIAMLAHWALVIGYLRGKKVVTSTEVIEGNEERETQGIK